MAKSTESQGKQPGSTRRGTRVSEVKLQELASKLDSLDNVLSDDEKVVLAALFGMINSSFLAVRPVADCDNLTLKIPENATISVEWDRSAKIPKIAEAFQNAFDLDRKSHFDIEGLEIDTRLSGSKCVAATAQAKCNIAAAGTGGLTNIANC